MSGPLFNAGSVLVPIAFGLVPGFLPLGTHPALRWAAWVAVLGVAAWYGDAMTSAPAAYRWIAWGTIAASALLSFAVLAAETGLPRRRRRPA